MEYGARASQIGDGSTTRTATPVCDPLSHIQNLPRLAGSQSLAQRSRYRVSAEYYLEVNVSSQELSILGRNATARQRVQTRAVETSQHPIRCLTEAHRFFQHGIKYRRRVARRCLDHLQHFSGSRLLFQRLALLGDEPRVLDRDHRLIGEGADEFDLLVGKWLHPLPREYDDADRFAFAQQRHTKRCALLTQSDGNVRIARNGSHVGYVHGPAFCNGPMPHLRRSRVDRKRYNFAKVSLIFRREPEVD